MSKLARPKSVETSRHHRHRSVRRQLSAHLFDALAKVERVAVVGSDPLLAHFAARVGIHPDSIASCQALLDNKPVTLVGVPSRLWYSQDAMTRLQRVKATMRACGRACFLLPQRAIYALAERDGRESPTDRATLLVELISNPERLGIDEACCTPEGSDPIGCRAAQLLTGTDCLAASVSP